MVRFLCGWGKGYNTFKLVPKTQTHHPCAVQIRATCLTHHPHRQQPQLLAEALVKTGFSTSSVGCHCHRHCQRHDQILFNSAAWHARTHTHTRAHMRAQFSSQLPHTLRQTVKEPKISRCNSQQTYCYAWLLSREKVNKFTGNHRKRRNISRMHTIHSRLANAPEARAN